jgi:murein DD-endopeptidase MepM/ murein hydrolase activator NlpD
MAQLPRRVAPDLSADLAGGPASAPLRSASRALGALAAGLLVAAGPARARAEVDLAGTWHVLVHYRDAKASNPDAERWEDRLWEFEPQGDRLRWTEFPIVVFEDEGGRFERRPGSGQYARVIHAWEPSPAQLANIRAGLAANDRGAQAKSLRRRGDSWSSEARASATGASVITYQERWNIEAPEGLPVFEQLDRLGSESAEGVEGRTRLRTERVLEQGDLLVGSYQRDGSRRGTFQMRRSGARRELAKKTQSELQAQAFARSAANAPGLGAAARGKSLAREAREIFAFAPESAAHDDSVRYRFPFDATVPRRLRMGVGGDTAASRLGPTSDWSRHETEWVRYSFDFELPKGAEMRAARAGRVALMGAGFIERVERGGRTTPDLQVVSVLHADGTVALYGHLAEVKVEVGQQIDAGDAVGVAAGPFVHFGVLRRREGGEIESVPIRFDDGTPEGVVPIVGLSYGGKRP